MTQKDFNQLKHDVGLLAAIMANQFPDKHVPKALATIADRNLPPIGYEPPTERR